MFICKGWRGGLYPSCEESESSGNLNVNDKRSLMYGRDPGNLYPRNFESFKLVTVKPSPIASELEQKRCSK